MTTTTQVSVRKKSAAVRYQAKGKLTGTVSDLEAARGFLVHDDMTEYIPQELVGYVTDVSWYLPSASTWTVTVMATQELDENQLNLLSEWIGGQNSDGLGESFEQQPFAEDSYEEDGSEYLEVASFDWQTNGSPTLTKVGKKTMKITKSEAKLILAQRSQALKKKADDEDPTDSWGDRQWNEFYRWVEENYGEDFQPEDRGQEEAILQEYLGQNPGGSAAVIGARSNGYNESQVVDDTCTVGELIEYLQSFPEESPVVFSTGTQGAGSWGVNAGSDTAYM